MRIIAALFAFAVLALGIGFFVTQNSGGPLPAFLKRPAFEGFRSTGENTYAAAGAQLKLDLKADQLKSATINFEGVPAERAGNILVALTGLEPDIAQKYAQYLTQTKTILEQPGGKTETLGTAFRLNTQIRNNNLEFDVRIPEIPAENFVPVDNILGQKNSSVVIRVFSDFECPYCEKFDKEVMNTLGKKLPAGTRLEFHHFPLESIHPRARPAAEASECAADQGQFWAFHDALFSSKAWIRSQQPQAFFLEVAQKLGLKTAEFETCIKTNKHKARVDAGLQSGQRAGVNGTPSVFVNGYKIENPYDPAAIEKMIAFARD
jgi:predicted DsbA family dithiol-disulfide isomerase